MTSIPPTNAADAIQVRSTHFNFDVKGFEKMAATASHVAQFKFTVDFHDSATAKTHQTQGLQGRVIYIAAGDLDVALKVLQAYAAEVLKSGVKVLDDKICRHVFFSKPDKNGACTASLYKGSVEEAKVTIDKGLASDALHYDNVYKAWEKGQQPINQPSATSPASSISDNAIAAELTVTHGEDTTSAASTQSSVALPSVPEDFKEITESTLQEYPKDPLDKTGFSCNVVKEDTIQGQTGKIPSRLDIIIPRAPEGFSFSIRRESIFDSGAQVIVNAANTHLGGGGGIDRAIHNKGGEDYKKAHQALSTAYKKNYPEGFATMISSRALSKQHSPITDVIVVAGPSTEADFEKKLYNCYYNSLVLAHNQNKTSIAFPAISTGIFGGDFNKSAEVSLRAVADFAQKEEHKTTQLKTISIHCYAVNDVNIQSARKDDAMMPAYQKAAGSTSS